MKKFLLSAIALVTAGAAYAGWSNDPANPVSIFPTGTISYATEVKAGPDGDVWAMIYHPNLSQAGDEYDTANVVYEYRLQHFDKDGNPTFPDEGMLLCDYKNWSYTVVNDYMHIDSEGNCILVVNDCRNSAERAKSYTAYKVAPDGTLLWGEDGVAVSDPLKPADLAAIMKIIELEDHSYVFAWMEYPNENDGASYVCMQRISNSGKAQWDLKTSTINDAVTGYPFLVNSGDNTFILVYTRTASNVVYARKLDFECESVWGKDVRIYRGGWGTTPLHTNLHVTSSGDGGALISWCDDRQALNIESPYLSYVTADGQLGFSGVSDEADCKLAYCDYRCLNVYATPAADGSCFYAIWRVLASSSQSHQAIAIQKVSKTGELLWGDEAKELSPVKECSLGYLSILPAGESGACGFWGEYLDYNDQRCMASRFDGDGNYVWADEIISISAPGVKTASLETQPIPGSKSWLANWTVSGATSADGSTYVMTIVNEDGTLGIPGVGVKEAGMQNQPLAYNGRSIVTTLADGTPVNIYNAAGALVSSVKAVAGQAAVALPPGLYIAEAPGETSLKFVVK